MTTHSALSALKQFFGIYFYSAGLILATMALLLTALPVSGQRLDIETWSVEHGLTNRTIKFATRDQDGLLWMVSNDIERYDGHRIRMYSKFDSVYRCPLSSISSAIQYDDSTLLIADNRDLYGFNLNNGRSWEFEYPASIDTGFTVLIRMIQRAAYPNIMMLTASQDHKTFSLIDSNWNAIVNHRIGNGTGLSQTVLRSYTNGPYGVLWLMDESRDVIQRIDSKGVYEIPFEFGRQAEYEHRIIYSPKHGLIIVRNDGLLYLYSENSDTVGELMKVDLNVSSISSLHFERSGDLWITATECIVSVDLDSLRYRRFSQKPFGGLRPELHHVFEDSENTTWYCTELGLVKVNELYNPFETALIADEGEQNIQFREIIEWNSPNEVICRIAMGERSLVKMTFAKDGSVDTDVVFSDVPGSGLIKEYDGKLYCLQSGKAVVTVYDVESRSIEKIEIESPACSDFYNQVIIDSLGVLHYWDDDRNLTLLDLKSGNTRKIIPTDKNIVGNAGGRVMFIDALGNYVYGTGNNGFAIIDPRGVIIHHYSTDTEPSISSNFVNAVVEAGRGQYWLGTLGGGLNWVDINTNTTRAYTTNDGLPNNLIASVLPDDEGQLWIGTYYGLSRLDTSTMTFYNYYQNDGLPNNEFNYLASMAGSNGTLYIGTFNGLVRFDPRAVIGRTALPSVRLTGVQKYNRKQDKIERLEYHLGDLDEIELKPTDNYVEVEFAVPAYKDNGSYHYRAKLDGLDEGWQDLGENSSLRLRHIPPGAYTLMVSAYDVQGNETSDPLVVRLQVQQALYKTWWFITALVVLLLGASYLVYRYRLNLIRKEAQTRTRIAVDLHDEIGSALTRISLQLQLMEQQYDGRGKTTLQRVGGVVDSSITKLRDLVWSVDNSSDSWNAVLDRMETFAHDTLNPAHVSFHLKTLGIDRDRNLKPLDKRNIYLIFKEALTNISKHGTGTEAWVELKNDKGIFELTIGNTLNTEISTRSGNGGGNGLKNLEMRAERIGGRLSIEHSDDRFEVVLQVPREV